MNETSSAGRTSADPSNDRMHVDRFTLDFAGQDSNLEQSFLEYYSFRSLGYVRFALVMGAVLIGIFGILDGYLLPRHMYLLWFIRYAVLCPIVLLIALSTYHERLVPWLPAFQVFMLILTASGFMVMIMFSPAPVNYLYYSGLILVLIYGYTFLRLRFMWGTLAGWLIVGIYFIPAALDANITFPILLNNLFFLVSANVIGMMASYSIEYYARNDFFLMKKMKEGQEEITKTNAFLESHVRERTAELRESNAKLNSEIAERITIDTALRESEERYRSVVSNTPVVTFVIDEKGIFTLSEGKGLVKLGLSPGQVVGASVFDVYSDYPPILDAIMDSLGGRNQRIEAAIEGIVFDLHLSPVIDPDGKTTKVIGVANDITDRKTTDQLLLDMQRRESLGILAGGIAHDFNNLLGSMMGNISIAQEQLPAEHPAVKNMEIALSAMERAARLTQQMLAYSGKGKIQIHTIDIGAVVNEHVTLFKVSLAKNIKLDTHLPSTPIYVNGDPGQLEQIIMNLIINGGDAIGERQGTVSITLTSIALDRTGLLEYSTITNATLQEGTYALLEVKDNGSGMSRETMNRIFDPFFSTKFTGRGLGLSAVLGIIQGHKGGMTVVSKEEEGTTFRLILPVVPSPAPVERSRKTKIASPAGHTPTVLVIDDEQDIAAMAGEMLESGKYRAMVALNPHLGIELYKQHRAEIGLVLLDLTMPEMSGKEVVEALVAFDPHVKIIISSGYSVEEAEQKIDSLKIAGFIQKPYRMQSLLTKVQSVL